MGGTAASGAAGATRVAGAARAVLMPPAAQPDLLTTAAAVAVFRSAAPTIPVPPLRPRARSVRVEHPQKARRIGPRLNACDEDGARSSNGGQRYARGPHSAGARGSRWGSCCTPVRAATRAARPPSCFASSALRKRARSPPRSSGRRGARSWGCASRVMTMQPEPRCFATALTPS